MSLESAKALVAKLHSDAELHKKMKEAASEDEFFDLAKKHGYDFTGDEFKKASTEFVQSDDKRKAAANQDRGKVGLSIVGVDYAFTGVETSKG